MWQTGHISKNFKGVEKCLTCTKNKHQEDSTCMAILMCISCNGNHVTVDKKMPENNTIPGDPEDYAQWPLNQQAKFSVGRSKTLWPLKTSAILQCWISPLNRFPISTEHKHPSYNEVIQAWPSRNRGLNTTPCFEQNNSHRDNPNFKQMQWLKNILKEDPDSTALWYRIWKTINLHIQISSGQ